MKLSTIAWTLVLLGALLVALGGFFTWTEYWPWFHVDWPWPGYIVPTLLFVYGSALLFVGFILVFIYVALENVKNEPMVKAVLKKLEEWVGRGD